MADAVWDNVVLAIQADDQANGSTTFKDLSRYGRTVTAAGTASITTSTVLSGLGSISINSAIGTPNAYIECAADPLFNPSGSTSWTIEGKFHFTTLTDARYALPPLFALYADIDNYCALRFDGISNVLAVYSDVAGTSVNKSASIVLSTGTTYDIAWVRDGSSTHIYVNGSRVISDTLSYHDSAATSFAVGRAQAVATNLAGYVDDIRVTMGVARYTGSSYTPLTIPFPIHLPVSGFAPFHADIVSPVSFSFPVTGFKAVSMGAPLLKFDAFPAVNGFAPVHFGTPEARSVFKVKTLGRVIRFGTPSVLNPPLKVATMGRITRFGIPRATATRRLLAVATLGCVTRFGTPAVPSNRSFAVTGFGPVKFGYPISLNYLPTH